MQNIVEKLTDSQKSLLVSIAFHLLLLLLFLWIGVGVDLPVAEFAEVSFISNSRGSAAMAQPVPAPSQPPQTVAQVQPTQPKVAPSQQVQVPKSEPVNLPKRRMLEDEASVPINREAGKITPGMETGQLPVSRDSQSEPLPRTEYPDQDSQAGAAPSRGDEGQTTAPPTDIGAIGGDQPFIIEGDASKRAILQQYIPQYPQGLQKEAVVKIRFAVLPDGTVRNMIPVKKGDPVLEEITMKSLARWRFNPLPPGAEQKNIEGIITFRYELK